MPLPCRVRRFGSLKPPRGGGVQRLAQGPWGRLCARLQRMMRRDLPRAHSLLGWLVVACSVACSAAGESTDSTAQMGGATAGAGDAMTEHGDAAPRAGNGAGAGALHSPQGMSSAGSVAGASSGTASGGRTGSQGAAHGDAGSNATAPTMPAAGSGNPTAAAQAGAPGVAGAMAAAGSGGASAPAPSGPGMWTTGMAMPTIRTELSAALLDGKFYVAGGFAGGFTGSDAFEAYDPASDSWEKKAAVPKAVEHPTLAEAGGKLYFTGGGGVETFEYDAQADSWTPRADMIYDRYAASATTLDGLIYVVGGQGASDTVPQVYDPAADKWTEIAPLSTKRDHAVAVTLDGKVWALGGRLGAGSAFDSVEIYDPKTNTWTAGPKMQDTHSGFGAAVVDGRIYVAGGEILVQQPYFVRDSTEMYDPVEGVWTYKAKLPTPLHGTWGGALNGKFYLFGGASQAASASPKTGVVHIFTP